MFSYYGSKSKIVDLYPSPKYGRIIEPFAGSARYSLKYFDRDVLLVDKYEVIVRIWKWLQKCSPADVLKLPRLKEGERVSDYSYDCEEARLLMGFHAAQAAAVPQDKATFRATTFRPNWINYSLNNIANNLWKIHHWEIRLGSYDEIPNEEATWFIDPPYKSGGEFYAVGNTEIDYSSLAEWCKAREGQVMVCENTNADWLPFLPMSKMKGSRQVKVEVFWSNMTHDYMARQEVMPL